MKEETRGSHCTEIDIDLDDDILALSVRRMSAKVYLGQLHKDQ